MSIHHVCQFTPCETLVHAWPGTTIIVDAVELKLGMGLNEHILSIQSVAALEEQLVGGKVESFLGK